jgi:hypothetical protein
VAITSVLRMVMVNVITGHEGTQRRTCGPSNTCPCVTGVTSRVTLCVSRQIRERDWCNVITGHEGDPAAYLWRLQHFTLGDAVLLPRSNAERGPVVAPLAPVTAVTLSHCGNFGVVGSASGRIDRYNVQSGQHRGYYIRWGFGRVISFMCTRIMSRVIRKPTSPLCPSLCVWVMKGALDHSFFYLCTRVSLHILTG